MQKQAWYKMQKEKVPMLGLSHVWLMPVTVFCSPLKWTWLKYLPPCAVLGCCTQPLWQKCRMPHGWGDSSFAFCQHLLEKPWECFLSGCHWNLICQPWNPWLVFFFFPQVVNVHHYFCLLFELTLSPSWYVAPSFSCSPSLLWFCVAGSRIHFSKDRWRQPCSL